MIARGKVWSACRTADEVKTLLFFDFVLISLSSFRDVLPLVKFTWYASVPASYYQDYFSFCYITA